MRKRVLPLWPIILIVFSWLLFSQSFFVKGLVPFPSTYLANAFSPWSAYGIYTGPIKNQATPDVIGQIYPWKELAISTWKSGEIPLWNPYNFSGTPLLANYQSAVLSPLNLLYFVLPFLTAWSIQILLQPLLAGLFTYLFARSIKMSKYAATISSFAFMYCGFITTWMMYGTLGHAIVFLPLALFSIEKYFNTRNVLFLVVLALTIPLSFFSGHFQISLYFLLFTVAYLIFRYITLKGGKSTLLAGLYILFGLLLSLPQLLPSMEFYLLSVRSALVMKTEVIPWAYIPTFLAPDFFGNPVTRNDWFSHYAEWNAYVGLIPFLLGIFALTKRGPLRIFFGGMALVSLLLAFQSPLLDLLIFLKIPVLSTSAASRIIVLFSFSIAILSGIGFDALLEDVKRRAFKKILVWLLAFGGILVLLYGVVGFSSIIPPNEAAISLSNLRLPILLFGVFAFLVVALFVIRHKKVQVIFPFLIVGLVFFDVVRFASKWQPYDPPSLVYPSVGVSNYLLNQPNYQRAIGNYGAELSVTYRTPSVEGYDPLYPGRYGEFIQYVHDGYVKNGERSVVVFPKNGVHAETAVNLLGIRNIIHKISDTNMDWSFPFHLYPYITEKVYEDNAYQVFNNPQAFPRSFIVFDTIVESDDQTIAERMFSSNLLTTAVIEDDLGIRGEGTGSASITAYFPTTIQIEAEASNRGLLILTDNYYPGWRAKVNGEDAQVHRADYTFRGIEVPKGKSTIELTYLPQSFLFGIYGSLIGLFGIVSFPLYNYMSRFEKKKKK